MNNYRNKKYQGGQVIITAVIFFLIISGALLGGATVPVGNQIQSAHDLLKSRQGYYAAEAINDDAFYRLNKGQTLPATLTIPFQNGVSATGNVTDVSLGKQILTEGDSGSLVRASKSIFSQGEGASFSYGLQVGNGGVVMTGSSKINGSVYANGNIQGCSSCQITGSATAANISDPVSNQSNGSGTPAYNVTFATSTARADIAQSFQVSTTTAVSSVKLYIKKVGSPSNATLRITSNSSGKPSGTTLAQGTISSSLLSTSYGYIEIPLSSSVSLSLSTTYWIVIDASNSTSNYYVIGASDDTYANGVAKIGSWSSSGGGTWANTTPSTLDLFFDIYVGGSGGRIYGESQYNRLTIGSGGVGNAWAHTVDYTNFAGTLYCGSGSYNYKSGTLTNCDTSREDPVQVSFPVSDANIADWKDAASSGGTYNGSITVGGSSSTTTGPKKINGNLTVTNSGKLYLSGPIWVTGNLVVDGSGDLQLDSSYGAGDGYIIVDGTVSVAGSGELLGSGQSGSYIMIVTTSQCPYSGSCSLGYAIKVQGSAGSIVLVAPYGDVKLEGSAKAKSIVGKKLIIEGSAEITYETGLTDLDFVNGPTGSWTVDSWQEVAP